MTRRALRDTLPGGEALPAGTGRAGGHDCPPAGSGAPVPAPREGRPDRHLLRDAAWNAARGRAGPLYGPIREQETAPPAAIADRIREATSSPTASITGDRATRGIARMLGPVSQSAIRRRLPRHFGADGLTEPRLAFDRRLHTPRPGPGPPGAGDDPASAHAGRWRPPQNAISAGQARSHAGIEERA